MYSVQKILFQPIFNQIKVPAFIVLADAPIYTIVASNDKYQEMNGISVDDLYGKGVKDIYDYLRAGQNHYALLIAGLQQAFETGEIIKLPVFEYELSALNEQDVQQALWQMQITPLSNQSGKLHYLLVVIEPFDVLKPTTNKQIPEFIPAGTDSIQELRISSGNLILRNIELEKQLYSRTTGFLIAQATTENERDQVNQLFMQAPASIVVLSGKELKIEMVNPHFQRLFTSILHIGMPTATAVPEILNSPVWRILQEVYRSGETFFGKELLHPMPALLNGSNEKKYFNFIYQARRNQQQEIDGIMIFAFDVTEIVMAKKALEDREKQHNLILNALPQIAWTNTVNGELNFINQRFTDFTGLNFEEILKSGWINTVHPNDQVFARERFAEILSQSEIGEFEVRKRSKEGVYFWFLTRLAPILNQQNEVIFWIGTSTNINALKV